MKDLHKSTTLLWTLALGFALVWLYALGVRTLVPPDEGRYAEMAREMFASGDWITTRLNGIKYFEKPPLQTWMNALTFAVFGLGDWQARLWTGLCGLGSVLLTGYTATRVFNGRVGFYSALVLGSCFYWVACGQINSLDMGLSGMMSIALCALLLAQRDGATDIERRNWMLLCWAGMALSVLAKGPIGLLLPGAVLVLYTPSARDWQIWTRLHIGKGLLLFFAITAPWFVLVGLQNPEQPHFFFIHENFERYLLKEHHREAAWWVFFALTMLGSLPWLGVLFQSLAQAFRREDSRFRPRLMLAIWAIFIILFFTKSNSKLPGYILPIFPALAMLIGAYLESAPRGSRVCAAALMAVSGLLLVVLGFQVTKLVKFSPAEIGLLQAYQPWVTVAGFVSLVGGALALLHARQLRRDWMVLVMAVAGFLSTEMILSGFEAYGRVRAGVNLVPAIKAELKPGTKLYSVGVYDQSLPFYLRHTMILVDYVDEFAFGLQQQPELAIPKVPAFVQQWVADMNAGVPDLALLSRDGYADLKQQGVPMRVVTEDSRLVVVSNH